jgi:sarcosine oxidase
VTAKRWDVIVLGLGAMGSSAAAHLAARGQRVLGLEQFTPVHDRGSSHGETRVIRQAYFEDPAYVPLLLRSYELWEDLEREHPGTLTITGGLMIGAAESAAVSGSIRSAKQWALPFEVLDTSELRRRFPVLAPSEGTVALYERRAGFVRAEQTVRAHLERAAARGAELHFREKVQAWSASGSGVEVRTADAAYAAHRLVIAPGAWAPQLLPELAPNLTVERQLLFWFQPTGGLEPYRPPRFPVFVWEDETGVQIYGFPAYGRDEDGVKIAFFRNGVRCDPDHLDRQIHPDEIARITSYVARRMPTLPGRFLRGAACMYTTTPDEHFVLTTHPHHPEVVIAAGFSGHGFKFVPIMGEIIGDLVVDGATRHPIGLFDASRLLTRD